MAGTDAAVAIYWDFENVHACLVDDADGDGAYRAARFRPQEPIVDIDPVTEYAATFGRVVVHRAYANWQYFGRYRDELQAHAIDLVQLFPLSGSKNGADIRLVLDVVEDMQHHPHVTHVIVVASDSDYTSLAQRCRKHGLYFLGVGTERTASSYQFACDEFRRFRDLAGASATRAAEASPDGERDVAALEDAADLVVRAIRRLAAGSGESWVRKAGVRPLVKRLDPTFDESGFGYPTFTELLKALDAAGYIKERPGEHDHELAARIDLDRTGLDRTDLGRGPGPDPLWAPALNEPPSGDTVPGGPAGLDALPDITLPDIAGAARVPSGSPLATLIERQLRRRGLRLPADRRILWEFPALMVQAFSASPDGTAASFDSLRLAVEALVAGGQPAPLGLAVTEAEFNKVKSILLHARAFTLLGRDRGISLQVPDTTHLRALIISQLLRHLADPADEEPAVLAEAFFGPYATPEQVELVTAVQQASLTDPSPPDQPPATPSPPTGPPASQAPAGHTLARQSPARQAPAGQEPAGQAATSQPAANETPAGHAPASPAPTGQPSASAASPGQAPAGQATTSQPAASEAPARQPAASEAPADPAPADPSPVIPAPREADVASGDRPASSGTDDDPPAPEAEPSARSMG